MTCKGCREILKDKTPRTVVCTECGTLVAVRVVVASVDPRFTV